ncbi:MAG: hypothetical protein ACT4QE_10420 [Anaerolineales bacterium]
MTNPSYTGFKCWNDFEGELRHLQQLYDFTAQLYAQEHDGLAQQRTKRGPGKSMHTTVGTITHNINRLYEQTHGSYPNKLRELLLVSSVTSLEVFLSTLIVEVSKRTLEPFMAQTPLELVKAQALSYPSIEFLQEEIISREIRQLTNGGLLEFARYFQSKFTIDFKALKGGLYPKVLEIHERRHLYVHRNGICDAQYARKYPEYGYEPEERVFTSHDYLINALNTLREFAAQIKNLALARYPAKSRKRRTARGQLLAPTIRYQPLLVRMELRRKNFDGIAEIPKIPVKVGKSATVYSIGDFTYQMIQEESVFLLVIAGSDKEVKTIMHALKQREEVWVRSVSRIFG